MRDGALMQLGMGRTSGRGSRLVRVAAAAGLALAGVAGCNRAEPTETAVDDSVVVTAAPASIQTLRDVISGAGTAVPAPAADQTVYAPEHATIAELPKAPGDAVAPGDLLVRFDIASITQEISARQSALVDANVRAGQAQAEVDKYRPLMEQGLIARVEYEKRTAALLAAQSAVTQAKAQLDIAELQGERTVVRARFPGVVEGRWHQVGDAVVPGPDDPIIRVIDPSQLQIRMQLPRTEAERVRSGLPATVTLPETGATEAATVSFAPVTMDPAAMTTEIRLAPQAGSALVLNMPVRVEILSDERQNAIVIPESAIRREPSGSVVMVIGDDGLAHRRQVRVGLVTRQLAQILEGLRPGESVITTGLDLINEGTKVRSGG
jgi:RND family efflux transporter MFP subunit